MLTGLKRLPILEIVAVRSLDQVYQQSCTGETPGLDAQHLFTSWSGVSFTDGSPVPEIIATYGLSPVRFANTAKFVPIAVSSGCAYKFTPHRHGVQS